MTYDEYLHKLATYATSDASVEVKEAAINKLKQEFFKLSEAATIALNQFNESISDTDITE